MHLKCPGKSRDLKRTTKFCRSLCEQISQTIVPGKSQTELLRLYFVMLNLQYVPDTRYSTRYSHTRIEGKVESGAINMKTCVFLIFFYGYDNLNIFRFLRRKFLSTISTLQENLSRNKRRISIILIFIYPPSPQKSIEFLCRFCSRLCNSILTSRRSAHDE